MQGIVEAAEGAWPRGKIHCGGECRALRHQEQFVSIS